MMLRIHSNIGKIAVRAVKVVEIEGAPREELKMRALKVCAWVIELLQRTGCITAVAMKIVTPTLESVTLCRSGPRL